MNKNIIKIPQGIEYITQWKEYNLPRDEHCIVDKGVTGCGYTELCLTNRDNIVLCSPRKLLLKNKSKQHKDDENIYYLENKIDEGSTKTLYDCIDGHVINCKLKELPIKILVTYDSLKYVVGYLKDNNLLNSFIFVVDEFQSIFLDSYFKVGVELRFVEELQKCPSVIYLSATPMLDKYLERLDQFKDLNFYYLDWSETGFVESVHIGRKKTNSLVSECCAIVEDYLKGKFITTYDSFTNKIVESREAVFYFNSVIDIIKVIRKMRLTPGNTLIICSDTSENRKRLSKIKFIPGEVPLKEEPNPMFIFCTSTVYIGVDFYSGCATSFIFADPNIDCLALDISLDLPQIIGRQRDKTNPFKNEVVLFYKIKRSRELKLTKENFEEYQRIKKNNTEKLLELYQIATKDQREVYVQKLIESIEYSNYSKDFVSISEVTGKPVYNFLLDIADERAWEVAQEDYQDSLTVTRAIINTGFEDSEFYNDTDLILKDFLDNYFYKTGLFSEKMRLYCEFRDKYGDNPRIVEGLDHKIPDRRFKSYYRFYGTEGCSALKFREGNLSQGLKDVNKSDQVEKLIKENFKEGDRLPLKEIKKRLKEIYDKLDIDKKAKATDLEQYFKISRTCITLPGGSTVNGFKLEKL